MKSQWTVYNIDSGLITRRLVTTEESVQAILREGEGYIADHYNDNAYMIKDGKVVSRAADIDKLKQTVAFELRVLRNEMLRDSDWTQVPDAPVDQEAWKVYRQALRDLPEKYVNETDIDNVVFPTAP